MWAAIYGHTAAIEVLIKASADISVKGILDTTPLMTAAESGNTAAIEVLLKAGADVRAKNFWGHNALWYANQNKDLSEADKKRLADLLWDAMMKK